MKKISSFLLVMVLSAAAFAQQNAKPDLITKINGEEMTGKVIEINQNDIKFSYSGETLVYTIRKTDIQKITFGSGRTEVFNSASAGNAAAAGPAATPVATPAADHSNRVAVLPFTYIRDGQTAVDVMSEKVQSECYAYMSKHSGKYQVTDPRTTNAMLFKAGINKDNIKGHTMDELCNLLGVEFLVDGTVTVNKAQQSISQSGSANTKKSGDEKNSSSNSYVTAEQEYETSLNLAIYNDKGSSIYDQQKKSILSSQTAYRSTLEYLLKRTPLYSK